MIDFPASPTVGQIFVTGTGSSYVWDGVAWSVATNQTRTAHSRNRIVNPAMQISQELGATATTTTGAYVADQWMALASGINFSAQKSSATAHQISINASTAKGSLAAGDYMFFQQNIEGQRLFDFGYGSTNADVGYGPTGALPSVLRFDVYCPVAGTYSASIRNGAVNRSLLLPFTVSAPNVWTTIVLTVPGDTTGTWPIDTTGGFSVAIVFAAGTTFQTAVSGWQAGNLLAMTGISNGAATTGVFYLRNVGWYLDPQNTGIPPVFQMPDYGTDLMECMRYWERVPFTLWGTAPTPWYNTAAFKAQKRTSPTIALTQGSANGATVGLMAFSAGWGLRQTATATTAADAEYSANARM